MKTNRLTGTQQKTLIYGLAIAFVSVVLLWVSTIPSLPSWSTYLLGSIASLLLVSVALYLVFDFFLRRAWINELFEEGHTAENIKGANLLGFHTDFQDVDFSRHFSTNRRLDMWVAYARTWSHQHQSDLRDLLVKPGGEIRLLVPDPDDDCVVDELARRFNSNSDTVKANILELTGLMTSLVPSSGKTVQVRLAPYAPLFSFYLFETTVVLALYKQKPGLSKVITMEGRMPGSLYEYLRDHFESMWQQARPQEGEPQEDIPVRSHDSGLG